MADIVAHLTIEAEAEVIRADGSTQDDDQTRKEQQS